MSVDVTIKSKGIFKKNLTIRNVKMGNMRFGILDEAFRLAENEQGDYMVIFQTKQICRGYEIHFERGEVDLRLPVPTSGEDIRFFYKFIKHICNLMGTKTFEYNGEKNTFNDIDSCIEDDTALNKKVFSELILDKVNNDPEESIYIFGAIHPISIGKREIDKINGDIEQFGKMMHELQTFDAYYPKPIIGCHNDNSYFGTYALTENVVSIFPFVPSIIMNENEDIKEWYVSFLISKKIAGSIPYEKFIENVNKDDIYDTGHFIITMDSSEMQKLIDEYGVELK